MNVTLDTAPVKEPLTLAETKAALGIATATTTHDLLIATYITAARNHVETVTRRRLISQTLVLEWDLSEWSRELVNGVLYLPFPPLQTITHIKTYDDAGAATTLVLDTNYNLSGLDPAKIRADADGWNPSRTEKAVEIECVVGYGDDETDVPYMIRRHLLHLVGEMFTTRVPMEDGKSFAAVTDSALQPFAVNTF